MNLHDESRVVDVLFVRKCRACTGGSSRGAVRLQGEGVSAEASTISPSKTIDGETHLSCLFLRSKRRLEGLLAPDGAARGSVPVPPGVLKDKRGI